MIQSTKDPDDFSGSTSRGAQQVQRGRWLGALLVAFLIGCGQPPSGSDATVDVQSPVVVSPNDSRHYDLITLDNGIEVMLVSDSSAEKSAAALSVGLGAASDPEAYPGMAHYLEHMLFMGSSQYPEPDGFMALQQSTAA